MSEQKVRVGRTHGKCSLVLSKIIILAFKASSKRKQANNQMKTERMGATWTLFFIIQTAHVPLRW